MKLEIVKKLNEKSKPIAVFSDGKRRFIQLAENDKSIEKYRKLSEQEIKSFLSGKPEKLDKLIKVLEKKLNESKYLNEDETVFTLTHKDEPNSVMFTPNFHTERELIYCHGASGSGKSTLVRKYAREYKLFFPKNKIYVISKIEGDESFGDMDYLQIPLDAEVLSQLDGRSFQDSLVVFDDTDTISDKGISKIVDTLKDIIAQEGRHYNTSAFFCTHMACNYQKTRILLNECHKFIIFPQSSGKKQSKNMFVNYGGVSTKKFNDIIKEPSRWCMISNTYPNYLVYDNKVELL